MVFLDDLKDLVLYKKPFILPVEEKNIRSGSAIFLITPNYESTVNTLSRPYLINKMKAYQSYYIERNANYVINHEGKLQNITDEDEYLCEVSESDLLEEE